MLNEASESSNILYDDFPELANLTRSWDKIDLKISVNENEDGEISDPSLQDFPSGMNIAKYIIEAAMIAEGVSSQASPKYLPVHVIGKYSSDGNNADEGVIFANLVSSGLGLHDLDSRNTKPYSWTRLFGAPIRDDINIYA
jgi:hypothetical protein